MRILSSKSINDVMSLRHSTSNGAIAAVCFLLRSELTQQFRRFKPIHITSYLASSHKGDASNHIKVYRGLSTHLGGHLVVIQELLLITRLKPKKKDRAIARTQTESRTFSIAMSLHNAIIVSVSYRRAFEV
ncbi:hypothetical protein GQX74_002471 [Glossina fuscipes]|nr:hypothetical protein GQX74_002471 [Glossina fuscipes]